MLHAEQFARVFDVLRYLGFQRVDSGESALFAQDIYGRRLRVEFVHRLREERRFPGVDALKAQITQDVEHARRLLGM